MSALKKLLVQQWFLGLLVLMVVLGMLWPDPGMWVSKHLGTKPFVFGLLFMTSMTFGLGQLVEGFRSVGAIAVSLAGTYLFLPVLMWLGGRALDPGSDLGIGLIAMGAVPTTLASAAIWTRLAGGNTALSVAMIIVSNLVNLVAGPAILKLALGHVGDWPFLQIVLDLLLWVFLPLALGQVAAKVFASKREQWAVPIGVISRVVLSFVILQAASKAAVQAQGSALEPGRLALLAGLCVAVHAIAVGMVYALGRGVRLPRADLIAAVMVGGQKTLPVGLMLLELYFASYAQAVLAMLAYHAIQLVFDTLLIEGFRKGAPQEGAASEGVAPAG